MTPNEMPQGYDELEALLPWYINGTLDAETRNRIATALVTDARLRKALELARDEAEAVDDINESIAPPAPRVLGNIMSRLPSVQRSNSKFAWRLLTERFTEFVAGVQPRTLVYTAVAAALVLVVQSGVIGMLALQNQGSGPELASVPENDIATQNVRLIVKFVPGATVSNVAELLDELDAGILKGPSGGGLFTIGLDAPQDGELGIDRLIREIESQKELVAFVSRAAP